MAVHHDIWSAMRASPAPATVAQLAAAVGCSRSAVDVRMRHWMSSGFVDRVAGKPASWRLATDAPAKPPAYARDGTPIVEREPATGPIWRAMRVLSRRGTFDVPLLALTAQASPRYAENYLNRLRRAGYIRLINPKRNYAGEAAHFRLIRDTGQRAPKVDVSAGRRVLIDQNTGARIDISPRRLSLRDMPAVAVADGGEG